MKKILLLTIVFFCLQNCELKTKETQAQEHLNKDGFFIQEPEVTELDGIKYLLYWRQQGGVVVINHTKELLEVQKLRKELNNVK
jgi:hypothetical protein